MMAQFIKRVASEVSDKKPLTATRGFVKDAK